MPKVEVWRKDPKGDERLEEFETIDEAKLFIAQQEGEFFLDEHYIVPLFMSST